VASIALVGESGRALLVDATPDLPAQLAALAAVLGRPRPVERLLLTHAHAGHYLGLAWLGREAMDVKGLPVSGTERMGAFLAANRPWSHLLDRGQVAFEALRPPRPLDFDGLAVTPFLVPHRAEDTDTVGLEVRGPRSRVVYVPDADRFPDDLAARVRGADVALVDGTFFHAEELPRAATEVPHPFVKESVARLAGAKGPVWFTHLNHTNPLVHPDPVRRPALPEGFAVLSEGATFSL
jgi:pyrroloquinoline quinone biosynthesis protein B